tara:strand:+ start:804 stop:1043 length:240 start_codon:yes stop_codon:yes gene_type:complete
MTPFDAAQIRAGGFASGLATSFLVANAIQASYDLSDLDNRVHAGEVDPDSLHDLRHTVEAGDRLLITVASTLGAMGISA